jgi:hypothetical protein
MRLWTLMSNGLGSGLRPSGATCVNIYDFSISDTIKVWKVERKETILKMRLSPNAAKMYTMFRSKTLQ